MPRLEQLGTRGIHDDARRIATLLGLATGVTPPHEILGPSHEKTTTKVPIRGAMILANDTPAWDMLEHPLAAGYALVTDATDVAWDQTPVWTGDHTFDDDSGDSPATRWIPENNDVWTIYAENNATPGNSDLIVNFPAADEDAQFIWRDNGATDVAFVDADGNARFLDHVGIGANSGIYASQIVNITETAIETTASYYGVQVNTTKTAGVTDESDEFVGLAFTATLNQAAGTIGDLSGVSGIARLTDGNIGSAGTPKDARAFNLILDLDGGTVHQDAYGLTVFVDQEAGNTVSGNLNGIRIRADADGTVTGAARMLFLNERSGIDWAIYHDSTATTKLGGDTKVGGTDTISAQLHVDQPTASGDAQPVLLLDQGDVSEQHIVATMGAADVDFPAILQLEVTGTPTLAWDESDDKWTLTKHLSLLDGDLYLASALGIIHADGVAAGAILVADGTRYVPGDLSDIGGAPNDAQYVVLALDGDLSAERVLVAGDSLTATDGGANGNITVDLDTPGTLTVSTANAAAAPHLHTITSSSNPGAAASLLATDASGYLTLVALGIGTPPGAASSIKVADDAWIGLGGGAGRLVFDSTPAPDVVRLQSGNLSLDGLDLLIDGDEDSYLHASADDVVDLVLAGATGEFGITINGGEDFTFTANAFNVLTGSSIQLSEYMYHAGDADTYARFQADRITLRAGGVDLLDLVEAGTDYVLFGAMADLNGNDLILDTDGDSYLHASADDVIDFVLATASGELGILVNGAQDFTFTANTFTVETGSSLHLSEYAYHDGDTDTYLRFQADQVTLAAGGVTLLDLVEAATDYVNVAAGLLFVNETANGDMTVGVTINQSTNDDHITTWKSSTDVSHTLTDQTEADTFGFISKYEPSSGGLMVTGLKDDGTDDAHALRLRGFLDASPETGKTSASYGVMTFGVWEGDGANDVQEITTAGANLFSWDTAGATKMILDAEGDLHIDAAGTGYDTFDEFDDAELARALDVELYPDRVIRDQFDAFLRYGRADLERARIATFNEDGRHFVNITQLQRLHNGAIWQQSKQIAELAERCALYERALIELGASPAMLDAEHE